MATATSHIEEHASLRTTEDPAENLESLRVALRQAKRDFDTAQDESGSLNWPKNERAMGDVPSSGKRSGAGSDRMLAELTRGRLWIREERNCLLRRQGMNGSVALALALLFCLGLASLFGLLLVKTLTAQWILVMVGLADTSCDRCDPDGDRVSSPRAAGELPAAA